MEEISLEELMRHAPDASREMASHLRVGVLSLPGVVETSSGDEARGAYSIAFSIDGDPVLRAHMEDPLRVTLEMEESERHALLARPDLARTEFQAAEGPERRALREIVEATHGEAEPLLVDLVLTSQEDLRAAVRLAHAKYDAIMTG